MTAFNNAVSYNLENAVKGVFPAFEIDYPKVLVCQGDLPGALNAAAVAGLAGKVDFSWDNNAWDYGADISDLVVLVVYDPLLKKSASIIGTATHADGTQTMTLPDIFSGDQVQCYMGFTNENQSEFSNGEFVAEVSVG